MTERIISVAVRKLEGQTVDCHRHGEGSPATPMGNNNIGCMTCMVEALKDGVPFHSHQNSMSMGCSMSFTVLKDRDDKSGGVVFRPDLKGPTDLA